MKTDKRELKKFGIILVFLFFLFSLLNLYKQNLIIFKWSISISIFILITSIMIPIAIYPIFVIISTAGKIIGWINTQIILGLVFYIIFTPVSLVLKILRKDLLDKKINKSKTTYWNKINKEMDSENFEKQY